MALTNESVIVIVLNGAVDVGHHDANATPRNVLAEGARRLSRQPVMFVGSRCPIAATLASTRSGRP